MVGAGLKHLDEGDPSGLRWFSSCLIIASTWLKEPVFLASRLLLRCAGLRIIATSQVLLDVAGEMLWSLTPMSRQICTALVACVGLAAGDLESAVAHTSGAVALHRRYGSREWDAFTLAVGVGVICRIAPPEATVVAGYLDRRHPYWREAMRSIGVEPLREAADVKGDQESAPESITIALDLVEAGLSRLDAGSQTDSTPSGTPLGVHARQRHR